MSDPAENIPDSAPPGVPPPDAAPPPRPDRVPVVLKLTLLVGLTLVPLLAVFLTGGWLYGRAVLTEQVDAQLSAVAASRRDMVRAQVSLLRQRVELNTDRGEMRGYLYELSTGQSSAQNRDGSQMSLARIANGQPIVAASLADETGAVVLSTDPKDVGRAVGNEVEFTAGLTGPYVGLPRWAHGRFEATLAAPVRTRSEPNRIYGVLLMTADVSDLAKAVRDVTGLGQTGEAILGVREGDRIRFLFPPRNSERTTVVPLVRAPGLMAATQGEEVFTKAPDYRGVAVLAASRPIGYGGWGLVVKMDLDEAYAPVARALRLGGLLGILAGAAGLAAAYALARSFTRPVRQLAEAAARVAGGDYDSPVPVTSADEFGALSLSFNAMTAAIRARRAERDAAEQALRASEDDARRAEEALRDADRRKDEFLAMLGHELRNPLSGIAGAIRLWQETGNEPEAAELARAVIERQTGNLARLVDDLLDVARITEGKIELRRGPVDVGETIGRAIEAVRPLLEARRHELDLALAAGGPLRVDADPMRLEQIVVNLLTNAAKYTPDGGRINLGMRHLGDEAVIAVSDNGIGIAPEMLAEIFDLFTQVDRSLDRTAGGLGIGLNLCRQLLALHGGTISAESPGPGGGATFTVRLPALPPTVAPGKAPEPSRVVPASRRRRILLVDDNQDTVRLLSRLLTRRGHEVFTTGDGLSALKIAAEFRPEVLLLDIGLPGLDGYALARRLRADGFAKTPMIAISGYAQESDRELAREAGFDHHFAKPVDFDELAALIAQEPPLPEAVSGG